MKIADDENVPDGWRVAHDKNVPNGWKNEVDHPNTHKTPKKQLRGGDIQRVKLRLLQRKRSFQKAGRRRKWKDY